MRSKMRTQGGRRAADIRRVRRNASRLEIPLSLDQREWITHPASNQPVRLENMLTGQLNGTDTSEFVNHLLLRGDPALAGNSDGAFALLYTEALALASLSPGDNPRLGLLANDDYGGPDAASKPIPSQADASGEEAWQSLFLEYNHLAASGSGARERQFNDQDNELELPDYSSNMGRWTSQNRTAQIEPVPDTSSAIPNSDGQPETSATPLNKGQLVAWMDAHALTRSSHHCAMYCRLGMEAAGLSTQDRPRSGDAGDYGPFLLRHGAQVVARDSYTPQVGDTAVFDKTAQHPNGHIEMYDGQRWVSDFMQHSFSPYRDAASTPPFTIYRLS